MRPRLLTGLKLRLLNDPDPVHRQSLAHGLNISRFLKTPVFVFPGALSGELVRNCFLCGSVLGWPGAGPGTPGTAHQEPGPESPQQHERSVGRSVAEAGQAPPPGGLTTLGRAPRLSFGLRREEQNWDVPAGDEMRS